MEVLLFKTIQRERINMIYTFNNINSKQYFELLKVAESEDTVKIVEALTGKDKNELTLSEIDSLNIGSLEPFRDPTTSKFFVADGVLYGLQDLDNMSFGLFQDIMSLSDDIKNTIPTIMSYLYRPIVKINWWNKTKLHIIAKIGHRLKGRRMIKWMDKVMYNIHYEIEKYNPLKCEERVEQVILAPSSTGHFLVTFFLTLSKELQEASLTSLMDQVSLMRKELKKQITSIKESPKLP